MLWLALAWPGPPVVPDVRFPFDPPDPWVGDASDRALTGSGCTDGAASFHPDAGTALDCTGVAGQGHDVTSGSPIALDGDFTVAAWIRPGADCLQNLCVIAAQGNTGGDPYDDAYGFLLFTEGGELALEVQFSDDDETLRGAPLTADTWTWAVASYEPGTVRLYLDGVLTDTVATRSDDDLREGLRVGYVVHRSYEYTGGLDELMVYDRALSDAEVGELWDWYTDGDGDGFIMDGAPIEPQDTGMDTTADTAVDTAADTAVDTAMDTGPDRAPDTGAPGGRADPSSPGATTEPQDTAAPGQDVPATPDPFDQPAASVQAVRGCRCAHGVPTPGAPWGLAGWLVARHRPAPPCAPRLP